MKDFRSETRNPPQSDRSVRPVTRRVARSAERSCCVHTSSCFICRACIEKTCIHMQTGRQAGRLTARQTERQTDRRTDGQPTTAGQTGRQADRQADRRTDGRTDGQTDGPTDTETDSEADREADKETDKPTDRRTDRPSDRQTDRPTERRNDGLRRAGRPTGRHARMHMFMHPYSWLDVHVHMQTSTQHTHECATHRTTCLNTHTQSCTWSVHVSVRACMYRYVGALARSSKPQAPALETQNPDPMDLNRNTPHASLSVSS